MEGIVTKSTGSWYTVCTKTGEKIECRLKGKFRLKGIKSTNPIAVGDLVEFDVETKGDESPLTIADKTANDIICAGLEKLRVQYPIISEENKLTDYEERKNWETCWLVDPLDGTKEFISNSDEFTVNIALIKNFKPIFGIVSIPKRKEIYYAQNGSGAYRLSNKLKTRLFTKTINYENENF